MDTSVDMVRATRAVAKHRSTRRISLGVWLVFEKRWLSSACNLVHSFPLGFENSAIVYPSSWKLRHPEEIFFSC